MSRSPLQLCLCPQPFGHAKHEFKQPYYFCLLGSQFPAGTLPLLPLSAQGCRQRWRGREDLLLCPGNSGSASYVAEGERGGRKTHRGSSSGLSSCPCHVSVLASPRHCGVSCSAPAHPACTWPSFRASLPAGKPSCLTTRIKCSPSNTCASGWHGRGCQLAGQPLLVTGGTLSLNHPGHPYSVHLAPCAPHLELPLSLISNHLVQL